MDVKRPGRAVDSDNPCDGGEADLGRHGHGAAAVLHTEVNALAMRRRSGGKLLTDYHIRYENSRMSNTQTDQGKKLHEFLYSASSLAENDPFFRLQQLIELFYKVREKMEEGSIEVLVQFLQISVKHIS